MKLSAMSASATASRALAAAFNPAPMSRLAPIASAASHKSIGDPQVTYSRNLSGHFGFDDFAGASI
jgi:hypothetical protein